MLPKENRLKKQKDFERVYKQGRGFKQDFLFLKITANDLEITRFGLVVSRKISKKAVIRNRLKRRLREIIRLRLEKIKKGKDVVLITLSGVEKKEYAEIEQVVEKLFKKAGLINPKP